MIFAEGAVATAVPAVADCPSPLFLVIDAAAPAAAVAVNVTGLPARPADVAVTVLFPTAVPSFHDVTLATPWASVFTALVGFTVPPPDATAKVTLTPDTGLLYWSRTITAGRTATFVFTAAVCPSPESAAI